MARITRHSFNCPHCKQTIRAGWGSGTYAHLPDQFNCQYCGGVITLSESQKRQRQYDETVGAAHGAEFRKDSRGCLFLLIGTLPIGFFIAFTIALKRESLRNFDAKVWLLVLGFSLLIGVILAGIITFVRAVVRGRRANKTTP